MRFLLLSALSISVFSASVTFADDKPYISVGQAKTKKTILAFPGIKSPNGASDLARTIQETVNNDLIFMDLFRFLDAKAFIEKSSAGISQGSFKYTDWSSIGADFVIKASLTRDANSIVLEGYLHDSYGGKQVLAKRYIAAPSDVKTLAHTFAGEIVTTLTGLPSIFQSKIAMSCEKGGKKEIYVMDFDGTNVKQITRHRSIAFAPAWSPDGTRLAYSLFAKNKSNIKNIDLYEYDFATTLIHMLSNRKGMNSGAAFHPQGKKIALTMSFLGNPEIFTLDPSTSQVTRLTHSLGEDVDPTWSPDGSQLAFVSSRSGKPMIFSMNADGTSPKRLTFAGSYNATPSWAPKGNKIAFAGWLDGHFDIFIMNSDGSGIERLTKNQGNNEDPNYSSDGNFIAFSSKRTGTQNIYVMNVDGSFVKRLTFGLGNCVSPKWSNPPHSAIAAK